MTQSVTFNVVPAAQVQIRILSAPTGSVVVGTVAAQPFTVQLLQPDGVTPLTNVRLTVAGPQNQVRLGLCNTGSCLAYVDSRGMVTTSVTPLLPGSITLNAVYLPAMQTASFTALGPPATLQFTTQPGPAGVVVGGAWSPLSLQAVAIGGSGPGTGYVSLTVNQGSAIVSPCPAPCGNKWDPNGLTNFWVKAIAPGPISITAMWGAIRQTLNFYAYAGGDVMQLVSGPSGTLFTQIPAAPVFAVQVFGKDGVTPAPGKSVTFATSIGSVRFAACGAATCSVISDVNGFASSAVTPTSEGVTTLTAYDGAANQAATFIAQDRPDVLSVVSAPAPGSYVGFAAAVPFSVHALWADGVTPAAGRSVTVAVTNGLASLAACGGASTCTLIADVNGMISTLVMPSSAGNVTLTATDRTVQVTASFLAAVKPDQMLTIFAPAGNVTLGNPALPAFAVRMLDGFGNPIAGRPVAFTATGVLWSACPAVACTVLTAADGSAAITATPIAAGTLALLATSGAQSQSASITGVMPPDTLALVSVPANGSFAGSVAVTSFAVQVLAGYPPHPTAGKSVTMTVTGGSALFSACGQPVCTIVSDAAGVASSGVEPLAAGPVTVSAQEGGATLQQTFNAVLEPDLLTDVSLLPLQIHVGDTFTLKVQALAAVGLAPDVGRSLLFTLVSGTASLAGCVGAACAVDTDAQGVATLAVNASVLGPLTFLVAEAGVPNSQQLPLVATVVPYGYTIQAMQPQMYIAEQTRFTFNATAEVVQGQVPVVGLPVVWQGSAGFSVAGADVLTDAGGRAVVQAAAGPLDAGVSATVSACVVTSICASFSATGVAASAFRVGFVSGAGQAVSGTAAYADLVARISDDAAHAIAGAEVNVYQTVTASVQPCPARGRCPAAPVLASSVTVVRSGLDGEVAVAPLAVQGVATQTEIALSSGSSGFATTVVSSNP